jgi:hypothetical protein
MLDNKPEPKKTSGLDKAGLFFSSLGGAIFGFFQGKEHVLHDTRLEFKDKILQKGHMAHTNRPPAFKYPHKRVAVGGLAGAVVGGIGAFVGFAFTTRILKYTLSADPKQLGYYRGVQKKEPDNLVSNIKPK